MFPIRDLNSEKESWYIPGIPDTTFDSFEEALGWLLMFLGWLRDHKKFEELVEELTVLFQSPLFQGIFREYLSHEEVGGIEEIPL